MILKLSKEQQTIKYDNADKIADLLRAMLKIEHITDLEKEHFWVIGVDPRLRIKYLELAGLGILSSVLIHPREIYRLAIIKAVDRIIIAHNHPSGDPDPSEEDIKITEQIKKAGEIIDIKLLDHIIVSENENYSFLCNKIL